MANLITFVIVVLVGLAVGSFLNVCIDRLPVGQSLHYPPSRCPNCQRRLAPRDLVPVLSYLSLKGRCRYCQTTIPQRLLWVELATGLMFLFLWWQYGLTARFAVLAFDYCVLAVILAIDLERRLILNKIVYPASVVALAIAALSGSFGYALIGMGVGLAIMALIVVVFPGGMGIGDLKMAALMGAMVYFPGIFVALMLAIVGAGSVAIVLVALKLRGRKDAIPFGPFLSIATMATLLWGQSIIDWYLGLFR